LLPARLRQGFPFSASELAKFAYDKNVGIIWNRSCGVILMRRCDRLGFVRRQSFPKGMRVTPGRPKARMAFGRLCAAESRDDRRPLKITPQLTFQIIPTFLS